MKKVVSIILSAIIVAVTLSGCAMIGGKSAKDLPLVDPLSENEIVDYYKQSLNYDNVVTRNIQVHQVNYELKDMDTSMKSKIESAQRVIESELYKNNYAGASNLSNNQYSYIKSIIDDKILNRDSIVKEAESLGYYFIDVKYTLSAKQTGTFLSPAKYLGIHGAFKQDTKGDSSLDTKFLAAANNELNVKEEFPETKGTQTGGAIQTTTQPNLSSRKISWSIEAYNKKAGGSLTQTAYMPNLSMVYTPSAEAGSLSGFGIYPQGSFGLRQFGYNRNSLAGNITLRYVFKSELTSPSEIEFVSVYPMEMGLTNKVDTKEQVVPQFVEDEISQVIERSDRALSDNDIAALASGNIYDDIGMTVLNGVYQNSTYLMRHISKLNKVISRTGNYYLAEVESLVQEGPKGTEAYGTYRDKYDMVFEEVGTKFVIDDFVCTKRELIKEPQIELDNSILKRLAALGLRGTISDDNKDAIKKLLNGLYTASTERVLKGMYASFDNDTSLLSSTRKEYLNSQLRGWLTKYGVETQATYKGTVSKWIGGANNQAEVIAEELINYEGKDVGQYMQTYYLLSSINDKWVIDEMKELEIKEVKGTELKEIMERASK